MCPIQNRSDTLPMHVSSSLASCDVVVAVVHSDEEKETIENDLGEKLTSSANPAGLVATSTVILERTEGNLLSIISPSTNHSSSSHHHHPTKPKKNVSFSIHNLEAIRVISNCLDVDEEEQTTVPHQFWYTDEEFHASHKAAKDAALTITQQHKAILWRLDETRRTTEGLSSTITNEDMMNKELTRIDTSCSGLTKWIIESEFRGLEGRSSSVVRNGKKRCRRARSDIVFDSMYVSEMELSRRYQETSRAARLWARMVGQADHLASLEVNRDRVIPTSTLTTQSGTEDNDTGLLPQQQKQVASHIVSSKIKSTTSSSSSRVASSSKCSSPVRFQRPFVSNERYQIVSCV